MSDLAKYLPEMDGSDEPSKLAKMLRKMQFGVRGQSLENSNIPMYQGRIGYQFDPNEEGNAWNVGVSGMGAYGMPNMPTISPTGIDVTYGNPNQNIRFGYDKGVQMVGETPVMNGFTVKYQKRF